MIGGPVRQRAGNTQVSALFLDSSRLHSAHRSRGPIGSVVITPEVSRVRGARTHRLRSGAAAAAAAALLLALPFPGAATSFAGATPSSAASRDRESDWIVTLKHEVDTHNASEIAKQAGGHARRVY